LTRNQLHHSITNGLSERNMKFHREQTWLLAPDRREFHPPGRDSRSYFTWLFWHLSTAPAEWLTNLKGLRRYVQIEPNKEKTSFLILTSKNSQRRACFRLRRRSDKLIYGVQFLFRIPRSLFLFGLQNQRHLKGQLVQPVRLPQKVSHSIFEQAIYHSLFDMSV